MPRKKAAQLPKVRTRLPNREPTSQPENSYSIGETAIRVKRIPVRTLLQRCNRLLSARSSHAHVIIHCPRRMSSSAGSYDGSLDEALPFPRRDQREEPQPLFMHQLTVTLLPLPCVVGTPGGIGTFRAMTCGPPVPFAAVAEKNGHTEALPDPQFEFVYPTGTVSLGHFFRNRRKD